MSTELVSVSRQASTTIVTLARPEKMNALSAELVEGLIEAVDAAHAANSDLIVFRGEGKNLSAGFDFGGFEQQSEGDLLLRFVRLEILLQKIATSSALTMALAHGKNFGAGVDLFGACMIRVAAPDSTYRMPGLKFGLLLGTRRFAALVGTQTARDVLTHTRTFGADEALDMGFVTQICPQDQWDECIQQAKQSAQELSSGARAQLYGARAPATSDADLAGLTRSAAEPGLKDRIRKYLGR